MRIFLSHAGSDDRIASEIGGWLADDGHELFVDHDLRDGVVVGEEWERRLHERLRWADALVCVVSPAYVGSTWCSAEIGAARSRGMLILPVAAQPGEVHPLLAFVQHTDISGAGGGARQQLADALRRGDVASGAGWPDGRSPFPGLRPFEGDMRSAFFGRTTEVARLVEVLRSPAERSEYAAVLVVGPSGCGKSSLVRAGVAPAMAREPGWWSLPPILPGTDPVAALGAEVGRCARRVGLSWTLGETRARLARDGLDEVAQEMLLAATDGRGHRLLVVVDQMEELLALAPAESRAAFVELVRPAMSGAVQLIGTLRSEFLDPILADPALGELPTRVVALRPISRGVLHEVIEGPAELARIKVDDSLVARLVQDTGDGDALPLLAFSLAELADGAVALDETRSQITVDQYDRMGGVQGALLRQADAALADASAASDRSQHAVLASLLRLVTVDDQARPTRRRVPIGELPDAVAVELDAFVHRRLLATDVVDGEAVIAVAHEAFLSVWPPLATAIATQAPALRARRELDQAAAEWDRGGRRRVRLWERGQLAAALANLGARPRRRRLRVVDISASQVELGERSREFLVTSFRRDRRRRGTVVTTLSVLLVAAIAAAAVAVARQREADEQRQEAQAQQDAADTQRQEAQAQQRLATARQLLAQAELARTADPQEALLLGIAADRVHSDDQTRASLVNTLTAIPYAGTLTPEIGSVDAVSFSPDGQRLATVGDEVVVWDSKTTATRRVGSYTHEPDPGGDSLAPTTDDAVGGATTSQAPPSTPPTDFRTVTWSGDGRLLITLDFLAREVVLLEISASGAPARIESTLPDCVAVALSHRNQTLACGQDNGTISMWDLADPRQPRQRGQPLSNPRPPTHLAFSPDDELLVAASNRFESEGVTLWALDTARPGHATADLPGYKPPIVFSADGRMLATHNNATNIPDNANSVVLWNLANPAAPEPTGPALPGNLSSIAFSPDGRTVATGTFGGEISLWDISDASAPVPRGTPLAGHRNFVTTIAFSPDGRLASSGPDETVLLWDIDGPTRPAPRRAPLPGHDSPVYSIVFTPGGRLISTDRSDTVIAWDLDHPGDAFNPLGRATPAATLLSPDGLKLVLTNSDGVSTVWTQPDSSQPATEGPISADIGTPMAMTQDGRTLVAISQQSDGDHGPIVLWDLSDPDRPVRREVFDENIAAMVFSPDEHTLVAFGIFYNEVEVWDVSDPTRPPNPLPDLSTDVTFPSAVAYSADGSLLAVGRGDGSIILWDMSDPTRPSRVGQPLGGGDDPMADSASVLTSTAAVLAVAFSPDGATLATSSQDGPIQLWDLSETTQPRRLGPAVRLQHGRVLSLAFSPDGQTLASGGEDTTVALWDLAGLNQLRNDPAKAACERLGRGLDRDEWDRLVPELEFQESCP